MREISVCCSCADVQFFEDKFNLNIEASLGFSDAFKFSSKTRFVAKRDGNSDLRDFLSSLAASNFFLGWLKKCRRQTRASRYLSFRRLRRRTDANIYLGLFFFNLLRVETDVREKEKRQRGSFCWNELLSFRNSWLRKLNASKNLTACGLKVGQLGQNILLKKHHMPGLLHLQLSSKFKQLTYFQTLI